MKYLLVFLFSLTLIYFSPIEARFILKERIQHSEPGDYVVTSFKEHYSLLIIRHISEKQAVIEEITIPSHQLNVSKLSWKDWVSKKAPGHSNWLIFYLDLEQSQLLRCEDAKTHLPVQLDPSDYLLSRLLALSFMPIEQTQRKKIGPPPLAGETDHRKIWNPPLFFEGKKIKDPQFEVWETRWPKDESALSGCLLELYFDQKNGVGFPYWIEFKTTALQLHLQVVDSGKGMNSPISVLSS